VRDQHGGVTPKVSGSRGMSRWACLADLDTWHSVESSANRAGWRVQDQSVIRHTNATRPKGLGLR
jgi:hypothetical protein